MAKRFTDTGKWTNPWFRKLSYKAKLCWIYLCDECESHGVLRVDCKLISFQLGYEVTTDLIAEWFGNKIHFISEDKLLIVPFFSFQYGESKDSWSAKVAARRKLESLGFSIENNEIVIKHTTVGTQCGESGDTLLIKDIGIVIGKGIGIGNKENIDENLEVKKSSLLDIAQAYDLYPRKEGKKRGMDIARREIKSGQDLSDLMLAIEKYKAHIESKKIEPRFVKQFSTFMGSWRDWLDADAGLVTTSGPRMRLVLLENGESMEVPE